MSGASLRREILRFISDHSSRKASEREFEALALKIFRFQFEHNSLYRKFCETERVSPENVKSWKKIPAMPVAGFRELVLTSFPEHKKIKVFKTSGTTGTGTGPAMNAGRGVHFFESLALYEAAIAPPFRNFVLGPSATKASADGAFAYYFLISSAANAPHSSLSHMMQVVNGRFAKNQGRFYADPRSEDLLRRLKKEHKKALLLATAFSLKAFLDLMKEKEEKISLRPGSAVFETGGFKGRTREISKSALYALCGKFLGIPKARCVSEYGMTELSSQYYSRARGPFFGPAWIRTLVVDPRTGLESRKGKAGLLRHFDLANLGSVMAVQTEDLGRKTGGGFELLGRAKGSQMRGCSLSYERFLRDPSGRGPKGTR